MPPLLRYLQSNSSRFFYGEDIVILGLVMTIYTFENYPDIFHPHLHAIVTDGLFNIDFHRTLSVILKFTLFHKKTINCNKLSKY